MNPRALTYAPLTMGQLEDVCDIERHCFPTPWGRTTLAADIQRGPGSCYIGASTPEGRVVGYAGMWIVLDHGHIGTLGVHPDFRRKGIGERLLLELLLRGLGRGIVGVTLEVRVSNKAAIRLYEKYGFVCAGIRRGYYHDSGEDAHTMALEGLNAPEYVSSLREAARALGLAEDERSA